MSKRVVITGGTGFLGSYLINELLNTGYEVISLQRKYSNILRDKFLNFPLKQIVVNLHNINELKNLNLSNISYFFHLAWQGVSGPDREDENVQSENIKVFENVLHLADLFNVNKFIGVGSVMEYELFFGLYENKKISKSSIYAASKSFCHSLLYSKKLNPNQRFHWIYLSNIYGVNDFSNRFINNTLVRIETNEDLNFTSANQLYNFIYVSDAALAIRLIAKNGIDNNYFVGSDDTRPLKSFIKQMVQITKYKGKLLFGSVPFEGVELKKEFFSINKLTIHTGFIPKVSFQYGIEQTQSFIKGLLNGNK